MLNYICSLFLILSFPSMLLAGGSDSFENMSGWTDTSGNWMETDGLEFSNGAELKVAGEAIAERTNGAGDELIFTLPENPGEDETYWVSFLIRMDALPSAPRFIGFRDEFQSNRVFWILDKDPSGGFATLALGTRDGGDDRTEGNSSGGKPAGLRLGKTAFIVAKISVEWGNDSVWFWINPEPGTKEPDPAKALASSVELDDFAGPEKWTEFFLQSSNRGQMTFDEFRTGNSYEEVAPVAK